MLIFEREFARMTNRSILFLLVTSLLIGGCTGDLLDTVDKASRVKEVTWNPAFAAPLINTTITLDDLVKDVNVVEVNSDDEGLVIITYKGEVLKLEAIDFVKIQDQSLAETVNLSPAEVTQFNSTGNLTIQRSFFAEFSVGDLRIDNLLMFVCNHLLVARTDIEHDVDIKLTFPGVTKNGNPLVMEGRLEDKNGTQTIAFSNNLSGYEFDMNDGPQGYNELEVDAEIVLSSTGGPVVSASNEIVFQNEFIYNEFENLFGYVGKYQENLGPEKVALSVFTQSLGGGSFTLVDPKIKIGMANSFGVPIDARITRLEGVKDGVTTGVTGFPDPLPIPTLMPSEIGTLKRDSIVLNKDNSNFVDVLNIQPDSIIGGVSVEINPGPVTNNNFITRFSEIDFDLEVEIPLWGTASDFSIKQEVPFELALDSTVEIENIEMKLYTENGFPVDLGIQLYFYDSTTNTLLDSLFDGSGLVLDGGVPGSDGVVQTVSVNTNIVEASKARIDRLRQANKAEIVGRFNTSKVNGQSENVKFMIQNALLLKFGVDVDLKVTQ
jgi:hypothetical protein